MGVSSLSFGLGGSDNHRVSVGFAQESLRSANGHVYDSDARLFIKTCTTGGSYVDERNSTVVHYVSPPLRNASVSDALGALEKRAKDWMIFVGDSRLAVEFLVRVLESEDDAVFSGADTKRETSGRRFSFECYCRCPKSYPILLDVEFDPEPVVIPEVSCPSCKSPMIFESSCEMYVGVSYPPRPSRDPETARLKKLFSGAV